jgi:hypothetical protein
MIKIPNGLAGFEPIIANYLFSDLMHSGLGLVGLKFNLSLFLKEHKKKYTRKK